VSGDSAPITVTILDREYQFTCEPGERNALREAAAFLDDRMREVKAAGKLMALERIAVMTALNLSDELLRLRQYDEQRQDLIDKRIRSLNHQLDDALGNGMD
jgi:cell division protein ZapA